MLEGCTPPIAAGDGRVARIAQVVADLAGDDLAGARVLDLGCDEGNFARAIARLGAREVLGIEGRASNLAGGMAKRDAEGLTQVELVLGDVRELSPERHGVFDLVLCLGLLYHLDAPDVLPFLRRLAAVCGRFAVIETQVALRARETVELEGRAYAGLRYEEDVSQPGASLDNRCSFWPTKPSLVNLLQDAGFTTVAEVAAPVVPAVAAFRDHTVLVAFKGARVAPGAPERAAERVAWVTHPAQGRRFALRERLMRRRGGGLPSVFGGPAA
jgi:SAM-dependent methyltransferase